MYGLRLTWPEQRTVGKDEQPDDNDNIVGRKYSASAEEAVFLNTTWSDFELCHDQGVSKEGPDTSDSLVLWTESEWSEAFQLPASITYSRLDLATTEMPIFNFCRAPNALPRA